MATRDHDRNPRGIPPDPSWRGKRLDAERVAYFALMNDGLGSREAARRVGVNYRTAKRWQAAAAPPAQPAVISARFLSLHERLVIADRVRQPGVSLRSVAVELGRPVATISRELSRNRQPDGTYQPHQAHQMTALRRPRPKAGKPAADPALRAIVQDGLDQRRSPQQISRRLRRDHPDRPGWHMTHETRTHPGNAARTRTTTACYASTSPRAPTCPCTPPSTWTRSRPSSTTDPG